MTQHRLHPTLADYVAIAINPALVMGLVGSLIYFLLEVLYQGQYPDRLQFCLSMFIMASVLISRIAMEDGYEHAAPFGLALAVVVALALNRFVDYGHGSMASFGWAINWGLMALTWWCIHQLTWDCTVLDEGEEPDSQGLLETVGIDNATGEKTASENTEQAAASDEVGNRRSLVLAGWEQVLNRKGRPHAPGVWVVYFSLASLPIFGIGQLCIPASNTTSRRYVFVLLCVYVACGLGLLLTTSFLALRRYLRGRRLEMPPIMAGTWLVTGAVLIVALLLVVALLPRPNPEYAISELPLRFSSRDQDSSNLSIGEEGTSDDDAESGSGVDHSPDPAAVDESQDGAGRQASPDGKGSATAGDKGESGSSDKRREKAEGGRQKAENGGNEDNKTQFQKTEDGGKAADKSQSQGDQSQQDKSQPEKSQGSQTKNQPPKSRPGQPANSPQGSPASGAPAALEEVSSAIGGVLAATFKWLFYAAVIGGVVYFAWHSREKLLGTVRDWIDQWRKFWAELWGRSTTAADGTPIPAVTAAIRRQRFAEFIDPFAGGSARQSSPAELVKYTFAALEAWGREHSCERSPDATPHEFARQVGGQFQPVAAGARSLADLYCRAAYAQGDLPTASLEPVRQLWQTLRSIDAQLVAAVQQS